MKTKIYFLIFLLSISGSLLKAQSYFPFPANDATWQVTRCFYFFPPGWYDDYQIHMTGEDTVINNITYKKLFFTSHHAPGSDFDTIYPTVFLGGLYETDKKVYIVSEYSCLDTNARLVYDFNNENIGDTIYSQLLSPGATDFIPHIITSVDSVMIGSEYHRRLQLTDVFHYAFEEWIEGVGSSYGLTYASHFVVTDNSYDLICFSENKQPEYLNPNPGFGYCQSPLPPIECDSLATVVPSILQSEIEVFPNPVVETLNVQLNEKDGVNRYELQTVMGETRIKKSFKQDVGLLQIDVKNLPSGLYHLFLYKDEDLKGVIRISKL